MRSNSTTGPRLLVLVGGCCMITPYVGALLGIHVTVPARVELADHVLPGLVVSICALKLYRAPTRARSEVSSAYWTHLALIALSFTAGVWMTVSHLPLLAKAHDSASWVAALWHATPGAMAAIVSGMLYARSV